ncbi:MAG TPA: hypothetical protein DCX67_04365 [Opitutae bacterium]|nr:hypothetical protein [Opitutae bacterium]|tara:strand:- start:1583 stop:1840 length:258 start_codon:yes stop_codon:yes gene_type:complete
MVKGKKGFGFENGKNSTKTWFRQEHNFRFGAFRSAAQEPFKLLANRSHMDKLEAMPAKIFPKEVDNEKKSSFRNSDPINLNLLSI